MLCQKCGFNLPDGASVCQNCGFAVGQANYQQANYQQANYQQANYQQANYQQANCQQPIYCEEIKTYFPQAILLMIFCCLPFGIVSLVYSSRVNRFLARNDYIHARQASTRSKIWAWIAFGCGFIFWNFVYYIVEMFAEIFS